MQRLAVLALAPTALAKDATAKPLATDEEKTLYAIGVAAPVSVNVDTEGTGHGSDEQICALIPLELADLLEMTRDAEGRIREMTREQEEALIKEPRLLLVALLVVYLRLAYQLFDITNEWRSDKALAGFVESDPT